MTRAVGSWTFAEIPPDQVKRDPFEAEFFVGEEDEEDVYGRTDSLVRELIQNALDARATDSSRVRVRLAVHGSADSPEKKVREAYLGELKPHWGACDLGVPFDSLLAEPMNWLVYEDFGTRGLCGDPMRREDPPPGSTHEDFYWFWRNIGRSGKSGEDLGRWGLGKTVLPATSRVNTILGLTIRADDRRRLLMGQSVLKSHSLGGRQHAAEGFFHAGRSPQGVPTPIEHEGSCHDFSKTFGLRRRQEPGLSVAVPYCLAKLNAIEILRSVIVHFFVPILRDDIEIDVSGPNLSETRVESKSIRSVAATLQWKGKVSEKKHTPPPFGFAAWAIERQRRKELVELRPAGVMRAPVWSESLFPDDLLERLREAFASEAPLAVRVPVQIARKDGSVRDSHFDAFLQRDPELERGEDHYVRDGLTISKVQALRSRRGIRGLVLVDHKDLSSLLGDAEGPAHNEWGTGESRPDQTYVIWKSRVSFVKLSLAKLAGYLTPPPRELDRDLLTEVFGLDQSPSPGQFDDRLDKKGKSKRSSVPPLVPTPRWYRLVRLNDGFRLSRVADVPVPDGAALRVAMAYDLPSGDPLKSWREYDFDLRNGAPGFNCSGRGVNAQIPAGNRIELTIVDPHFTFSLRGFDSVRDLYVRVDEVDHAAATTATGDGET